MSRQPLFAENHDTESYDQDYWDGIERRLRSLVYSLDFRCGNEDAVDALYQAVCHDLNLMGCGIFWGYVAAHREPQGLLELV